jgi:hypothetical protein
MATQHAAGPEFFLELRILRIIGILGFLFGVQVVEVAEKYVEAVHGGKKIISIAEVILAELPRGIAERIEQFGNGRIFLLQTLPGAGQADLSEPGADRRLMS